MTQTCQTRRTRVLLEPTSRVNGHVAPGVSEITLQSVFESEETALLHYAFSLVGRRAVAEDIVQEVFLELHKRWAEVECPKAWLVTSVRNRAFRHLRDHKREVLSDGESNPPPTLVESESPGELLIQLEAVGAIRQFMEELDEPDRELVKLKYFEDLKYREISQQTGLTIGNVGYRLHHILKELAAKLQKLGFDEQS